MGLGPAAEPPVASTNSEPGNSETKKAETPAAPLPVIPQPTRATRLLNSGITKPVPVSMADLRNIELKVKSLVEKVSPAVVAVEVRNGSGSGVIISPDGLVLTAGHVVTRSNLDVQFTFPDGKTAKGKTVGLDSRGSAGSDTGLMKITDPGPWPYVPLAETNRIRIGDWVIAMGHPGGFDAKRSLVVRLGRVILMIPGIIQTDCTISPGDSGGPLFDMYGRVIGVHSAISSSAEDNFHVPIAEFYENWPRLVTGKSGAVFGATLTDEEDGCRVSVVTPNSPAARAGLKVGDYVSSVSDGRQTTRLRIAATLQRLVDETSPGETLDLDIKRGDESLTLHVQLAAAGRTR
jgi:serine protease Do